MPPRSPPPPPPSSPPSNSPPNLSKCYQLQDRLHLGRSLSSSSQRDITSFWERKETPISSQALYASRDIYQKSCSTQANPHVNFCQRISSLSAFELDFIGQTCKPPEVPDKSAQAITLVHPIPVGNRTMHGAGLSQANKTCGWPKQTQEEDAVLLSDNLKLAVLRDTTSPGNFVEVLKRIQILEEQQSRNTSVVAALRTELEHARARVQELELAQKLAHKGFDNLLKGFANDTALLCRDEQRTIEGAVVSMRKELERENKANRRLEKQNMKLSRNLLRANKALRRAEEELEKERKLRELVEGVCDELANEIGQDKAEVEMLKRENAKVSEEVEEERKMLQMAEVWREERVQMKLEEARLEIEEKKQLVDILKRELDVFLNSRRCEIASGSPGADLMKAQTPQDALYDVKKQSDYQQPEAGLNSTYDGQPACGHRNMLGSSYSQAVEGIAGMHLEYHGRILDYGCSQLQKGDPEKAQPSEGNFDLDKGERKRMNRQDNNGKTADLSSDTFE